MDENADVSEQHRRLEVFRSHHPGDSRRLASKLLRAGVLTAGEVQEAGLASVATDEEHALQMFKSRRRAVYGKEIV